MQRDRKTELPSASLFPRRPLGDQIPKRQSQMQDLHWGGSRDAGRLAPHHTLRLFEQSLVHSGWRADFPMWLCVWPLARRVESVILINSSGSLLRGVVATRTHFPASTRCYLTWVAANLLGEGTAAHCLICVLLINREHFSCLLTAWISISANCLVYILCLFLFWGMGRGRDEGHSVPKKFIGGNQHLLKQHPGLVGCWGQVPDQGPAKGPAAVLRESLVGFAIANVPKFILCRFWKLLLLWTWAT